MLIYRTVMYLHFMHEISLSVCLSAYLCMEAMAVQIDTAMGGNNTLATEIKQHLVLEHIIVYTCTGIITL